MKQLYAIDLVNSYFSKEEATELILGLINYKIDFHSKKNFANQVRFGEEDADTIYRLEKLCASRDQLKAYLETCEDPMFKLSAELKIEPRTLPSQNR